MAGCSAKVHHAVGHTHHAHEASLQRVATAPAACLCPHTCRHTACRSLLQKARRSCLEPAGSSWTAVRTQSSRHIRCCLPALNSTGATTRLGTGPLQRPAAGKTLRCCLLLCIKGILRSEHSCAGCCAPLEGLPLPLPCFRAALSSVAYPSCGVSASHYQHQAAGCSRPGHIASIPTTVHVPSAVHVVEALYTDIHVKQHVTLSRLVQTRSDKGC
jgi:hypothetical protein